MTTASPQAPSLSATASASSSPAAIAKAALRQLALQRLEPTPENYARAYAAEGGQPSAESGGTDASTTRDEAAPSPPECDGPALADLIERIVKGVELGGKQWTRARKRDSLKRVLGGSRSDAQRLQNRLAQLVQSWQDDSPDVAAAVLADAAGDGEGASTPAVRSALESMSLVDPPAVGQSLAGDGREAWLRLTDALGHSVCGALPQRNRLGGDAASAVTDEPLENLGQRIAERTQSLHRVGADPLAVIELETLCQQADRVLLHREHLLEQMNKLCHELTDSLSELAEDESWAKGQCVAMRATLEQGLSTRGVRSVAELLRVTRERQVSLRLEREQARDALKSMIQRMLGELGELGATTGRFHESVGRYADVIEQADSLEGLAGAVREMVEESRTVASVVSLARQRMDDEHSRAEQLASQVTRLESELQRLSTEVSTDQLTQIANRRGLIAQFEIEQARRHRDGSELCLALLDIDNFKRLNDTLGHAAGDEALRALAQAVKLALRPTDMVARFGGEEFVVVLPGTPLSEAQQILTRLQRGLSGSLFMHDNKPVFVTFSAGVTAYRGDESLESALERADVGLYEAKRTGKNRTCVS